MDFWEALESEIGKPKFASERIAFSTKTSVASSNRPDTSFSMVRASAIELKANEAIFQQLKEPEIRYIIAKDITFGILITIYDVNSQGAIALRASLPLQKSEIEKIRKLLGKFRRANLEMRIVGMQNGERPLVKSIEEMRKSFKGGVSLIEADLFGNLKRNIAFDLRTGMSYDLLLLDRAYRVGELANDLSPESFRAAGSKIKFV
ncbi:MAG: hypothetical protein KGH54_02750 [Candidatus Micrarchaeota archaeon]|nr:hypothetical protein [Candidatus Micrarchaeota archaeon]